jgi:Cellulase (glycosyl hydrolase family 5)
VVRWWFHTNGTRTPGYDATGMALPISSSNISDVKSILDAAHAAGVVVTISLWSFDMLKANIPAATLADNVSLLTIDANRQAYIDNVLTPLVTALAGHPGLYAWETFNEPEGMASGQSWRPFTGTRQADGGTLAGQSVDEMYIQRTVNWFAAAIHSADSSALVTNGTWQFQANANVAGMANYYSDSALQGAGGKTRGTLDFYEVHYYSANGPRYSPFMNGASYWALDKPIVIGEFYALAQDGVAAADTYTTLHTGGYHGAWAWQYLHNDGTNGSNNGQSTMWPVMQVPMQNLFALAPGDIDCP